MEAVAGLCIITFAIAPIVVGVLLMDHAEADTIGAEAGSVIPLLGMPAAAVVPSRLDLT